MAQTSGVNVKLLAEAMYNGYGNKRGWKVASGGAMPRWEQQAQDFREGWEAAAEAGLRELRLCGRLA